VIPSTNEGAIRPVSGSIGSGKEGVEEGIPGMERPPGRPSGRRERTTSRLLGQDEMSVVVQRGGLNL